MPETTPPLLKHALESPSDFTPESLMQAVRASRNIQGLSVPPVCVLEFDGDLTDWLVSRGIAHSHPGWACFHTTMFTLEVGGLACGIVPRTIGGPYAVLIAEQLLAAGVKLIVGLTSAGRVAPALPLPCLVVAAEAIRDEGTSYHYLAPAETVDCPTPIAAYLIEQLRPVGLAVRDGLVWTTDAPYREPATDLMRWAERGALAVEMQAASLFAFASARHANVAVVAIVSNSTGDPGQQFDTGSNRNRFDILQAIVRASYAFLDAHPQK